MIAASASCSDSPTTPDSTDLKVVVERAGDGSDADGVAVDVANPVSGGRRSVALQLGDSVFLSGLGGGDYVIRLSGLAEQCVSDSVEMRLTVAARPAEARFHVDCTGQFAYARWFSGLRQDVVYLDERGVERMLLQGGWDIPRDWSPDGQAILVERWIDDRCETYRVRLDGSVDQVLTGPSSVANAQWSPAGNLIAVQYGPCSNEVDRLEVVLVDAQSLAPVHTVPAAANELDAHPVWSPDGREVAFVRSGFGLYTYDLSSAELTHVAQFGRPVDFPAWSRDGQYIAVLAFFPQQLIVLNRQSGEIVATTPDSIIAVGGAAAWLPDSRSLVFNGIRNGAESLYAISIESGLTGLFTTAINGIVSAGLSVAHDGRVMFVAGPGGTNALFVAHTDGNGSRLVKSDSEHLQLPMWRRTSALGAAPVVTVIAGRATRSGFDSAGVARWGY